MLTILEVYRPGPARSIAGEAGEVRQLLAALRAAHPNAEFVMHGLGAAETTSSFVPSAPTPAMVAAAKAASSPGQWIEHAR